MSYRSNQTKHDSDSDNSTSSDDSDSVGKKSIKRRRALVPSPGAENLRQISAGSDGIANGSRLNRSQAFKPDRKINTIWADVVAEQQLTQTISGSISVQGPKRKKRGPETYNYQNAASRDDSDGEEAATKNETIQRCKEPVMEHKSTEFDVDPKDSHDKDGTKTGKQSGSYANKKRPRQKLHDHKQLFPMQRGVKFEANEEQDPVSLAEKLSIALNEQKADLITRCLRTLGMAKCVKLYEETEKIERNGGMLTLDNQRRRSPGGIFLYCLKNDAQVTSDQKNSIFGESKREDRAIAKGKRRTKAPTPQSFKDSLEDLRSVLNKKRPESADNQNMDVDEKICKHKKGVSSEERVTSTKKAQDPFGSPGGTNDNASASDLDDPVLL